MKTKTFSIRLTEEEIAAVKLAGGSNWAARVIRGALGPGEPQAPPEPLTTSGVCDLCGYEGALAKVPHNGHKMSCRRFLRSTRPGA